MLVLESVSDCERSAVDSAATSRGSLFLFKSTLTSKRIFYSLIAGFFPAAELVLDEDDLAAYVQSTSNANHPVLFASAELRNRAFQYREIRRPGLLKAKAVQTLRELKVNFVILADSPELYELTLMPAAQRNSFV